MSKIGAFLSGIAGVAVLVGYFLPSLNDSYYLILAGGVLALISAAISAKARPY
ncbi:MAG: hypothetical protein AABX71_00165 [Nanoarchaeota archaeon]